MKKASLLLVIIILFSLVIRPGRVFAASESSNLDTYLKYFYGRYTKNFDSFGLQFTLPIDGTPVVKVPDSPREWMQLASYYRFRAQEGEERGIAVIRSGILSSLHDWQAHPNRKLSFADAIAAFLSIRMVEEVPGVLSPTEKDNLQVYISSIIKNAVLTNETENRALIAGAHWQYLVNYLNRSGKLTEQERAAIGVSIKAKIDTALHGCVNASNWYFEAKRKYVSPHYHAVSAYMLMFYAEQTRQAPYVKIAQAMYKNTKKISFQNGMVESKFDIRPVGLGAQFYLMQGLLGKYANDDDYRVYLTYAKGSKFFSNPLQPNALEYHSTLKGSTPVYYDDYSFVDAAEVGLVISALPGVSLQQKIQIAKPIKKSQDPFFSIWNTGTAVTVNARTFSMNRNGTTTNRVK
jgi:hypothetical protein